MTGRLSIVMAGADHAPAMAEFFREVWTPDATDASVAAGRKRAAASNQVEPGVPPPTWLAIQDSRVIGYVTTIPARVWNGTAEYPSHWIKGLMVLPDFRNGPIGFGLLKAATTALPRTGGFAVAMPAIRLFGALGYTDLGAIPNWVKLLRPGNVLRRMASTNGEIPGGSRTRSAIRLLQATHTTALAGWMAGQALAIAATARRPPLQGIEVEPLMPTDAAADVDRLWSKTRPAFRSAPVRDAKALSSQYADNKARSYSWIGARKAGELIGVAILKQPGQQDDPRFPGVRFATLSDVLCQPDEPRVAAALLKAAEPWAREAGADAIIASTSNPGLGRALARQSYVSVPGNVHFLFRDVSEESPRFGPRLEDWWLTRGDGAADEAF